MNTDPTGHGEWYMLRKADELTDEFTETHRDLWEQFSLGIREKFFGTITPISN